MKTEILKGWMSVSGNLDTILDGETVSEDSVRMSVVLDGTLSALVELHIDTASLAIVPVWQVSDDELTWYDCLASDATPVASMAAVSISADADAIALSLATKIADADAIVLSVATDATGGNTFSGVALNGVIGDDAMSPPRAITVTTASNAGSYNIVDPFVVTGTDVDGNVLVGSGTLTDVDGNETIEILGTGGLGFASVVSVFEPEMEDTGGHITVGVGAVVLNSIALDGVYGTGMISPVRAAEFVTDASPGAFALVDVTIDGLDADGEVATEDVSITDADGSETLVTTQTYSSITRVYIPAMADTDGAFTVGLAAVTDIDPSAALAANPAANGWKFVRVALRLDGNDGSADDTYSISYSFRRNRS